MTDWGIVGSGLCGKLSTGPFTATLGKGSVHFDSIEAVAQNGSFDATYKGVKVHFPWLETDLTGDSHLQSGGGKQAYISFPLSGTASPKNYANITLKATNLQFTKEQNIGWAVKADTHFDFTAENKPFAGFDTSMFFGMDGRAYFEKGGPTKDVSLGGSSHMGDTPLDLVSAHLTAPVSGENVLGIEFQTKLHLSEVMPAADVQVNYGINNSGSTYSSTGPTNSPFTVDVPYPAGQPSTDAQIHPNYNGAHDTEYSGKVDLSEFGGPPITGEFRLGYQGGHDYWLTRVSIGLGETGVPLVPVPPIMNLYMIRGGLGHNFPLTAFKDADSINNATPQLDDSFVFMAGLRVGMPDQFTYMLDGDLSIKATGPGAGARMDFHAWLLKHEQQGNGDFAGFFQYSGGDFDGRLWGHLDFMGGAAYFDLGNSESNAAVELHFGSGSWHIYAGKKEGPRIRAHLLVTDADSYFMLSNDGLSMGGRESIDLEVGDSSVASAYVKGFIELGVGITPAPHISGDFSAAVDAGVCAFDLCASAGLTAAIHAEALPIDIRAQATISLPWPAPDVSFSVHL